MKKYILLVAATTMAATTATAQNVVDAVRYGNSEISGTARYRSMAGAFGALGGDPSCMSDNPAGLAIYRGTSSFSFTPHMSFTGIETLGSEKVKKTDSSFGLSNFSWIGSFKNSSSDYLVSFNLGISVDRRQDNHSRYDITLDGPKGSFGNYLTNQANNYLGNTASPGSAFNWDNQYSTAPFLSLMAYNSFAIVDDPSNPHAVIDPLAGNEVYQRLFSRENTRLDNYNISAAANIDDRFYIGATLCITDFNSTIETEFDEDYSYDYNGSYIAYDNRFEAKGSGVGLNVGLMWMPVDNWRIGAAIHTPTWTTMREFYDGSMITDDENVRDWETFSDDWQYDFSTPWEYQVSTAFIFERGLISVEYDMRDYTSMEYSHNRSFGLTDGYFHAVNEAMKDNLAMQHTFKLGGEYRINSQFSARAGYAFSTSPYTEQTMNATIPASEHNITYYSTTKPNFLTLGNQQYASCGMGWRGKQWFIDMAFVYHHLDQKAAAYPGDFSTCTMVEANSDQKNWDMTIGYRF